MYLSLSCENNINQCLTIYIKSSTLTSKSSNCENIFVPKYDLFPKFQTTHIWVFFVRLYIYN